MSNLQDKDKLLNRIYYDVKHPSSFGTAKALHEAVNNPSISLNDVELWLSSQIPATLHATKLQKYKRNKVVVNSINEQWQTDLVDMSAFTKANSSFKYIVTVIDLFSKFAWAFPAKKKTPECIIAGFEKIFTKIRPLSIQSDQGTEFCNAKFKSFLKSHHVRFFTTRNTEIKCAIVERFNRTLRNRMFKYFTAKGTRKFIDVLDQLLISYNGRVHSATGFAPKDVTEKDTEVIFKKLYGYNSERELLKADSGDPKLKKGNSVRISYLAKPLDKGYYPNWTDETFEIAEAIKGHSKPQYVLKDHTGEKIEGKFYPEEIQKIEGDLYRIKILKYRTKRGVREAFVSWVNYPDSANRWIPENQIQDL